MNSGIYIRLSDDTIILGESKSNHVGILQGIPKTDVVSAGHFMVLGDTVNVYGDSWSLNISRMADDIELVKAAINNNQQLITQCQSNIKRELVE